MDTNKKIQRLKANVSFIEIPEESETAVLVSLIERYAPYILEDKAEDKKEEDNAD